MTSRILLCALAFLLGGCGGGESAPTGTKIEAATEQPNPRHSVLGESCGRSADCDTGLRCLSQTCVHPDASKNAEQKYMAMMETMCECSRSQNAPACMKIVMADIQTLFAAHKDLAENKQLHAVAEANMAKCFLNKKPSSENLGAMKAIDPAGEALAEDAAKAAKATDIEFKAAEAEEVGKEGKLAKVDPKKVGLEDLLATHKLGASNSGFENKLAVAMGGAGTEFELGHGLGTRGMGFAGTGTGGGGSGGAGRIGGTGAFDTGGGMGSKRRMRSKKRTAKLKLRSGSTQGFCRPSDIRSKLKRRAGAIRACYERALKRNPKLAGKVSARWTIGMDGRVMGRVSAPGLGPVGNCVAQKLQNVRFKPPEGGVCVIRWPFVFSSGG
jgi:hypothetical protein